MKAIADGYRIRIECEAGTFYLQPWEALKVAAEIGAAADDLSVGSYTQYLGEFDAAVRRQREWYAARAAKLEGDEEC